MACANCGWILEDNQRVREENKRLLAEVERLECMALDHELIMETIAEYSRWALAHGVEVPEAPAGHNLKLAKDMGLTAILPPDGEEQ